MSHSKDRKRLRRETAEAAAASAKKRRLLVLLALGAVLTVVAAGAAWFLWEGRDIGAGAGTPAKPDSARRHVVESFPSEGDAHLRSGERAWYRTDPPTSGAHDPVPTPPGFYRDVQPPEKLVHALEHGNIVIYYDQPDAAVLDTLRNWVRRHPGKWDGIVVTPRPGLKRAIVLTAWRHRLRLEEFDADAAASFIDRFRGRGPEKPVR